MRLLKSFGALLLLASLLVGVPTLLLAWGNPLALLGVNWSTALTVPDDGTITLGLLAVVAWVAWSLVALTTVGELITAVTRGAMRLRIPGTAWLRPVLAGLVTAALAPLLALGTSTGPTITVEPGPAISSREVPGHSAHEPRDRSQATTPQLPTHVVGPGDELWTVAERYLGTGDRWREIVAANPGMKADTRLELGHRLQLPLGAAVASAGPSETRTITVRAGDTLWDLAETHLGDPERWPEIFEANRDVIANPDEIDIGWTLTLPASESANLPPAPVTPPTEPPAATPQPKLTPSAPALPAVVGSEPAGLPPAALPELSTTPGVQATAIAEPDVASPTAEATPTASVNPPPTTAPVPPSALPSSAEPVPVEFRPSLDAGDASPRELLGPLGAMLAAVVVVGVATRRRAQLLQRALGQRVIPANPEARRFWTALARHADPAAESAEHAATAVVLGWRYDTVVQCEVEAARCLLIEADAELAAAATGAVLTSLLCAPWSASVEVVAVDPQENWAASFDDPRLTTPATLDLALSDLQRLCARRRIELGSHQLTEIRRDDDVAEAWSPTVFVFCEPLSAAHLHQINDCLSLGEVGVSVVATSANAPRDLAHQKLAVEGPDKASLDNTDSFRPQLIDGPARRAIVNLFASATTDETEPAPWWAEDLPTNVTPLRQASPTEDIAMPDPTPELAGPTLHLLGPVELSGCAGSAPTRAMGQCMEYCAWLLEHPGATPTRMVQELLVAEGTRRSNMSRLRTWLGSDGDRVFLPDAYSGTITLDPSVTSDWETFQLLLSAGVNRSSKAMLREALGLVRGEPLEGYSFQWGWAEQLRTDMMSMITDAAIVLTDRTIIDGDFETAAWAIAQGRLAASFNEALLARKIHVLALLGDTQGRDETVRQLTRSARAAGQDLQPETVRRIHIALNLTTGPRAASAPN